MSERNTWLPYLLLIMLALIWGSSFILMKEGLKVMSSIQMAAYRIALSGAIFSPFVFNHFKKIAKSDRKYVLLAGLMGSAIPSFLFAFAQKEISSSLAGVLNALTPIFTLLIAAIFTSLILSKSKIVGVVIGFLGAMALILSKYFSGNSTLTFFESIEEVKYALLVIIATLMYGSNINLIKTKLSHYKAFVIATTPIFLVSIPAMIILLFTDWSNLDLYESEQIFKSFGAVSALAIFGTAISLILFNRLVQLSGPVFASSVTYFIPFVALFLGYKDGENIGWMQLVGMILILIGVYLINKRSKSLGH